MTLLSIRKEIEVLPREHQEELREWLEQILNESSSASKLVELERDMFAAGLLSEIKPTIPDYASATVEEEMALLIKVDGKPLSETVIEDRR